MKNIFFIISLCVALLPALAQADQAAYISKDKADIAANILQSTSAIRHYCQPCGDKQWTEESINSVKSEHTGYENYWQVLINGKGIDLAYVYLETDGGWQNIAIMLSIEVSDVPKLLPNTSPVTEK
ncbi:MAG: hypothetical protein GQ569_12535 [Methylococcaceae bacterium]|nr:hypothetical protein [Methylococcaceae bacterium]